jgi:RNA-directed DNA polymerase
LEPIFEADFEECSYGFRPGRSAHDALRAIHQNLKDGLTAVYDADLSSYFDTIPHDQLMACVRMRVVDGSVLGLIRQWLNAAVVETSKDGNPPDGEAQRPGHSAGRSPESAAGEYVSALV